MTDVGLTPAELSHANTIIGVGQSRHASTKDIQTAVAVALDESSMQVLANPGVPASLTLPHDGIGTDADSVGLFQQRPSQGWGTVAELMDPATSATKFYDALDKVPGKDGRAGWLNAQMVQRSFDPTGTNYLAQWLKAGVIVGGAGTDSSPAAQASGAVAAFTNAGQWLMTPANWQRIGVFALGAVLLALAGYKLLEASGGLTAAAKVGKVFIP